MSYTTNIEFGTCDRCCNEHRGCMICAYGEPYMFICRNCSPVFYSRVLEVERIAEHLCNDGLVPHPLTDPEVSKNA